MWSFTMNKGYFFIKWKKLGIWDDKADEKVFKQNIHAKYMYSVSGKNLNFCIFHSHGLRS